MRSPLLLFVLTLAACHAGRVPVARLEGPPPPPPIPSHGWVLLQPTSSLWVAPYENAEHAQYFPSLDAALKDEPFPVFRLLSVDREQQWAEVQTTWDDQRHCSAGLFRLADFDLRLFVRVSDLATVTTREVKIVYPDDTAVTFTAGVPLLTVDGHLRALAGGLVFPAPAPPDAIGSVYEPSPHFGTEGELAWLDDWAHPGVRFAGVTRPQAPLDRYEGEGAPIYARRPAGGGEIVTLRTRCKQLEVVVSSGAIATEAAPMGGLMGSIGGSGGSMPRVHQRAMVYARHGEALGLVRANTTLFAAEVSGTVGRRCFHYPLRANDDGPGLDLCFTDTDLYD